MNYLYIIIGFIVVHLLIRKFAASKVASYLLNVDVLLRIGQYTDGCTTPFKNYIHAWLSKSHLLCAAHDFGSLGFISGVRPGWHNNLITLFAHMTQRNPVYWVWGTIVTLITLPWVVWRRNWGIKTPFLLFHFVIYLLPIMIYILVKIRPYAI